MAVGVVPLFVEIHLPVFKHPLSDVTDHPQHWEVVTLFYQLVEHRKATDYEVLRTNGGTIILLSDLFPRGLVTNLDPMLVTDVAT